MEFAKLFTLLFINSGLWPRSRSSLCWGKYIHVGFTFILGFVGLNPGISTQSFVFQHQETRISNFYFLLFIGKDVSHRFWLSWLFLPTIQWIQKAERDVRLTCTILPLKIREWRTLLLSSPSASFCMLCSCRRAPIFLYLDILVTYSFVLVNDKESWKQMNKYCNLLSLWFDLLYFKKCVVELFNLLVPMICSIRQVPASLFIIHFYFCDNLYAVCSSGKRASKMRQIRALSCFLYVGHTEI